MRTLTVLTLTAVLVAGTRLRADDAPKMPEPQKEHALLQAFAGEWETEAEIIMEPGKPPVQTKGTESTRMLGGFWFLAEMKGDCMGVPFTGVMTVGYNAEKKKYVGTWVCSMCDWLCQYEGSIDASGKVLTLECEGPNPATPGKTVKMRDVIELKSPDHKVLTSSMLGEDGKWHEFMTMTSRRKK